MKYSWNYGLGFFPSLACTLVHLIVCSRCRDHTSESVEDCCMDQGPVKPHKNPMHPIFVVCTLQACTCYSLFLKKCHNFPRCTRQIRALLESSDLSNKTWAPKAMSLQHWWCSLLPTSWPAPLAAQVHRCFGISAILGGNLLGFFYMPPAQARTLGHLRHGAIWILFIFANGFCYIIFDIITSSNFHPLIDSGNDIISAGHHHNQFQEQVIETNIPCFTFELSI